MYFNVSGLLINVNIYIFNFFKQFIKYIKSNFFKDIKTRKYSND